MWIIMRISVSRSGHSARITRRISMGVFNFSPSAGSARILRSTAWPRHHLAHGHHRACRLRRLAEEEDEARRLHLRTRAMVPSSGFAVESGISESLRGVFEPVRLHPRGEGARSHLGFVPPDPVELPAVVAAVEGDLEEIRRRLRSGFAIENDIEIPSCRLHGDARFVAERHPTPTNRGSFLGS